EPYGWPHASSSPSNLSESRDTCDRLERGEVPGEMALEHSVVGLCMGPQGGEHAVPQRLIPDHGSDGHVQDLARVEVIQEGRQSICRRCDWIRHPIDGC